MVIGLSRLSLRSLCRWSCLKGERGAFSCYHMTFIGRCMLSADTFRGWLFTICSSNWTLTMRITMVEGAITIEFVFHLCESNAHRTVIDSKGASLASQGRVVFLWTRTTRTTWSLISLSTWVISELAENLVFPLSLLESDPSNSLYQSLLLIKGINNDFLITCLYPNCALLSSSNFTQSTSWFVLLWGQQGCLSLFFEFCERVFKRISLYYSPVW